MRKPFVRCLLPSILAGFLTCAVPASGGDYEALTVLISKPVYPSWDEARKGFSDEQVIGRAGMSRWLLKDFNPSPPELKGIADQARAKLDACHLTLERIEQLNGKKPDYQGIANNLLKASPAMFRRDERTGQLLPGDQKAVEELAAKGIAELVKAGVNNHQIAKEWGEYRRHYAALGDTALRLAEVAKNRPCLYGIGLNFYEEADGTLLISHVSAEGPAAKAGLRAGDHIVAVDGVPAALGGKPNPLARAKFRPGAKDSVTTLRVARDGGAKEFGVSRTLRLDHCDYQLELSLDGSCDGAFDTDDLSMKNISAMDLTNCTVVVTLATDSPNPGKEYFRQHLHYVGEWPKGETRIAMYHNAESQRIAQGESFDRVQRVSVQLYSDQIQSRTDYSYWNSRERKADLSDYCKNNVEFSGKFIAETDGFFSKGDGLYHTDAGVRLWLDQVEGKGIPKLSLSEVAVTVKEGRKTATAVWDGMTLEGGGPFPFRTFSSPKFNAIRDPDSVEVRLSFPGTDYQRIVRF